jgi:hypothetical protein
MSVTAKENIKGGQQDSKEPWKPPVQSDHQPSKGKRPVRERDAKDNETA